MNTKDEAEKAGKALLKRMRGKGWKLDVWENLGWHYAVYNGPLSVHPSYNGKPPYSTLLSGEMPEKGRRNLGGLGCWVVHPSFHDPNEAVLAQAEAARKYLDEQAKSLGPVVEFVEALAKAK